MTQFDWTPILVTFIGLIGTLLSAGLTYVWQKHIQPWLAQKGLTEAAQIVVDAVEALLGRYGGEEKWALALEKMRDRGYYVESDAVIDALKAAWTNLNLAQIAAGIKDPPTTDQNV